MDSFIDTLIDFSTLFGIMGLLFIVILYFSSSPNRLRSVDEAVKILVISVAIGSVFAVVFHIDELYNCLPRNELLYYDWDDIVETQFDSINVVNACQIDTKNCYSVTPDMRVGIQGFTFADGKSVLVEMQEAFDYDNHHKGYGTLVEDYSDGTGEWIIHIPEYEVSAALDRYIKYDYPDTDWNSLICDS